MAGARSHKDLICWQRAYELKLHVYELLEAGTITGDVKLREQLRESAASAPRLMAEGSRIWAQRIHRTDHLHRRSAVVAAANARNPQNPKNQNPKNLENLKNPGNRTLEPLEPYEPIEPNYTVGTYAENT